jgi:hypothetical protein
MIWQGTGARKRVAVWAAVALLLLGATALAAAPTSAPAAAAGLSGTLDVDPKP